MSLDKSVGRFARCVQCASGSRSIAPARSFSCVTTHRNAEATTSPSDADAASPPPPPPDRPSSISTTKRADPNRVSTPAAERRILREQGLMPIGSRRRRAALASTGNIPFSQLPYQCFQEARKFLQEDRQEKLQQIDLQRTRIQRLLNDEDGSQDPVRVQNRVRSMRNHLDDLKILADSNDPLIKKRFEDGMGDLDKPIYRHLADKKWRTYKRVLLMQRIEQMNVVPDVLPTIDPTVSTTLSFGKKRIEHGAFVESLVSEQAPRLDIQCFDKGSRLVTIAVVTPDVPDVAKDGFAYRCHFLASNVEISPTSGRVDLGRLDQSSQVVLPWLPPYAQKGAPYHRMSIFILQQSPPHKPLSTPTQSIDVGAVKQSGVYTTREGFKLRSYADKYQLAPVGVDLFRTQYDEATADVMKRNGIVGWDVEFKPKKIEPLPYKRKSTERYR